MKKTFLFLAGIALFAAACKSNTSAETDNDSVALDTNITPAAQQYCYSYIKNRDTVTLNMMSSGPITTGELKYNLYEKDKNNGIFEGELHGDTLLAEYTFNAEGKESIRQVAFLKKGNQLLEGYGDMEDKNGKMMFKNTSKLTFGNSITLDQVDCH